MIVGGGFAGAYAAKKLENDFAVTLIDNKDYFEFTPSVLRTLVEPNHIKKIQVLHSHYLKKAKIVRGNAEKITPDKVFVEKKEFRFDYLLICTGSNYNLPFKDEEVLVATRAEHLREYQDKLKQSKKILIIGGGLVGVELAGEIVDHYPSKEVTIIQSGDKLLVRSPQKVIDYITDKLKRKIKIIYNEAIEKKEGKTLIARSGKKYSADLSFLCTGIKPNFQCLKDLGEIISEKNYVCVNENLQINGFKNIFAAGDITDIKEEKMAQTAEKQAEVVVKNLYNLEQGKKLQKYQPQPRPMLISLGKWRGIFNYRNIFLTGLIPGIMKQLVEWKAMRKYR